MKRLIAIGCVLAAVARAGAEETGGSSVLGLTAKIGTLGYGADVTLRLGQYLNLRGGVNMIDYTYKTDVEGAEVTAEADLQTFPILADIHPFGGGFRISGGVVINNNQILVTADAGEVLDLDGGDYEVESFDGSITFDSTGYYAGFGYGNAVGRDGRWHFACDFGVLYHGEPQIEAHAEARNPALRDALNSELDAKEAEWQEDAKGYKYYPVISVGLSFAF